MDLRSTGNVKVGIGLAIERAPTGELVVLEILPGSPALNSNLQVGDYVTWVDGIDIRALDSERATGLLKGTPGTEVILGTALGKVVRLPRFAMQQQPMEHQAQMSAAHQTPQAAPFGYGYPDSRLEEKLQSIFGPPRHNQVPDTLPPPSAQRPIFPSSGTPPPALFSPAPIPKQPQFFSPAKQPQLFSSAPEPEPQIVYRPSTPLQTTPVGLQGGNQQQQNVFAGVQGGDQQQQNVFAGWQGGDQQQQQQQQVDLTETVQFGEEMANVTVIGLAEPTGGVGMSLGRHVTGGHPDQAPLHVLSMDPQGSAQASGCINIGDELVAIDNVTCSGQPMTTVTALMGGNPGDPVQLVVKGKDGEDQAVMLIRQPINQTLVTDPRNFNGTATGNPQPPSEFRPLLPSTSPLDNYAPRGSVAPPIASREIQLVNPNSQPPQASPTAYLGAPPRGFIPSVFPPAASPPPAQPYIQPYVPPPMPRVRQAPPPRKPPPKSLCAACCFPDVEEFDRPSPVKPAPTSTRAARPPQPPPQPQTPQPASSPPAQYPPGYTYGPYLPYPQPAYPSQVRLPSPPPLGASPVHASPVHQAFPQLRSDPQVSSPRSGLPPVYQPASTASPAAPSSRPTAVASSPNVPSQPRTFHPPRSVPGRRNKEAKMQSEGGPGTLEVPQLGPGGAQQRGVMGSVPLQPMPTPSLPRQTAASPGIAPPPSTMQQTAASRPAKVAPVTRAPFTQPQTLTGQQKTSMLAPGAQVPGSDADPAPAQSPCKKCSAQLPATFSFCPSCGASNGDGLAGQPDAGLFSAAPNEDEQLMKEFAEISGKGASPKASQLAAVPPSSVRTTSSVPDIPV